MKPASNSIFRVVGMALGLMLVHDMALAQLCPARPAAGSPITDPPQVRSSNGVISGVLSANFEGDTSNDNRTGRYCLMYSDGSAATVEAPVFRIGPGERVAFRLSNNMPQTDIKEVTPWNPALGANTCSTQATMTNFAVNLHFHGMNVKPTCGADESLTTLLLPGGGWQYNFALPDNDPPGLYWYHPHVHMLAQEQMLGGMTGALVIDSPNAMPNVVGGLRERILVIRDQELNAPPAGVRYLDRPTLLGELALPVTQRTVLDQNAVAATDLMLRALLAGGTIKTQDGGVVFDTVMPPWKDMSVNWVPVQFAPSALGVAGYTPAGTIQMEGGSEFWRVANASADNYLRLQVRYGGEPQEIRITGMDGIPISSPDGQLLFDDNSIAPGTVSTKPNKTIKVKEVLLPPGGRAEFIVKAPKPGVKAELVSLFYETAADYDARRTLASILPPDANTVLDQTRVMPMPQTSVSRTRFVDTASSSPTNKVPDHLLYFSQSATEFFITEDPLTAGKPTIPAAFSMTSGPSIIVPTGAIQEWRIENRALEAHAFHIHQVHFRVLKRVPSATNGAETIDELALRDTIDLPAWSGIGAYPSVTLRLYFNEADIRGNFMYHCHILEHENNGMMAIVRVEDPVQTVSSPLAQALKVARNGKTTGSRKLALRNSSNGRGLELAAASSSATTPSNKAVRMAKNIALKALSRTGAGTALGNASGKAGTALITDAAPLRQAVTYEMPMTQGGLVPVMRDKNGNIIEAEVCRPGQTRRARPNMSTPPLISIGT